MSVSERITELRGVLGLTRKKFCSELGVSIRTIEGIENEGNRPRSDLIEKIVEKWPEFGLWLISGSLEFRQQQTSPDILHSKQINIVDTCDPRFIHNGLFSSKLLKDSKLIFVQNLDDSSRLAVLIELEEFTVYSLNSDRLKNGYIWLGEGYLRFDGAPDGRNYLRDLERKFRELNLEIIKTAQYKGLTNDDFEKASKNRFILFDSLREVQDESLLENFQEWKGNGKYTWSDELSSDAFKIL